jgi:hypothetical protein
LLSLAPKKRGRNNWWEIYKKIKKNKNKINKKIATVRILGLGPKFLIYRTNPMGSISSSIATPCMQNAREKRLVKDDKNNKNKKNKIKKIAPVRILGLGLNIFIYEEKILASLSSPIFTLCVQNVWEKRLVEDVLKNKNKK